MQGRRPACVQRHGGLQFFLVKLDLALSSQCRRQASPAEWRARHASGRLHIAGAAPHLLMSVVGPSGLPNRDSLCDCLLLDRASVQVVTHSDEQVRRRVFQVGRHR